MDEMRQQQRRRSALGRDITRTREGERERHREVCTLQDAARREEEGNGGGEATTTTR